MEVIALAVYIISIADEGLKAHHSEGKFQTATTPQSNKEEVDDELLDDMSRMSMMDDGFKSTTGRLVRFDERTKSLATKKVLERPSTILPHMMAYWKDAKLMRRVSLRIQLLFGNNPVKLVNWRVSTDQKSFILGVTLDESFMTPEEAFHCQALACVKDPTEHRVLEMVLQHQRHLLTVRQCQD